MRPGVERLEHRVRIHLVDIADEPEVEVGRRSPVNSPRSSPGMPTASSAGRRPVLVDEPHELAADLRREHLAHHVDRLGRRHAVAAAELARGCRGARARAEICGPPPCTTTGRTPAYRRYTMSSANARDSVVVDHRVAAELHDDRLAVEPLEPRQRLDEYRGLDAARFGSWASSRASISWSTPVLVHVVVREVVREDRRRGIPRVQVDEHVQSRAG